MNQPLKAVIGLFGLVVVVVVAAGIVIGLSTQNEETGTENK